MMSRTPNYSADPVNVSFRRALSFLDEPWVHQFLFSSHTTYREQVQQSLLQPHRITADMMITTVNPTDALSLNEHLRFLLLPSFSTGHISVSYQVTYYVNTNVSLYKEPYIARCVRDDVNGILLTIAEVPGTGLTEISCCSQYSPGYRDHVFMILETQTFRDVMRGLSIGYDSEKMKAAFIYTFHSCELRQCSTCGQRSVACACPLRLVRKKHPMDFDADLHNLSSYLGSYDGVSHQAIYEGGVNVYNGMCHTRASVEFSYDSDGRRKLETWALQDSLRGRSINLMKLAMPAHDTGREGIELGDNVPELSSRDCPIANEKDNVLAWSPFSDDIANQGIQFEQFMSAQEVMDFPSNLSGLSDHNQRSYSTSSTTLQKYQAQGNTRSLGDSNDSSKDIQSTGNQVIHTTQSLHGTQQLEVSQTRGVEVVASLSAPQLVNQPASQQLQMGFNKDDITRPRRMGRPPAPKIRAATRVVPIVPATNAAAAAGVQQAISALSEEARRKVALRKARNRASAMRSNERKKKQIQELKDCLAKAKKREATLKSEETSLRQTNSELKAKLAD